MNPETQMLIKELSDKLGTTAEHLYTALVKQAPISSGSFLFCLGLAMIALLATARPGFRYAAKEDAWDTPGPIIAILAWSLVLIVTIAATATELPLVLAGFFNPEYWALKQLIP